MDEREVIQVLRQCEHDLMNELQVIHGYLSMDNLNMAKDKMNEFIDKSHKKRLLMNTNAPKFILWLLTFNEIFQNIRLTYQFSNSPLSLEVLDHKIVERCNEVVLMIDEYRDEYKTCQMDLEVIQQTGGETQLKFTVIGDFTDKDDLIKRYKNSVDFIEGTEDGFVTSLLIS